MCLGILFNELLLEVLKSSQCLCSLPRYFEILGIPANDDHPVHDVAQGQVLIKEVYEALRASPQWNEILLLITYDEHGGFHDHVPTPLGVPSPDGLLGSAPPYSFDFTRLGVRVPTLLISPWIEAGRGMWCHLYSQFLLNLYIFFCIGVENNFTPSSPPPPRLLACIR